MLSLPGRLREVVRGARMLWFSLKLASLSRKCVGGCKWLGKWGFVLPQLSFACGSEVACCRSVAEGQVVVGARLCDAEAPKVGTYCAWRGCRRLAQCTRRGWLVQATRGKRGSWLRMGRVHGVGGCPRYAPRAVRVCGRPWHRSTGHVRNYAKLLTQGSAHETRAPNPRR